MPAENKFVRTVEKVNNYVLVGEAVGFGLATVVGAPAAAIFFANALVVDGTTTALYHGWKNRKKG